MRAAALVEIRGHGLINDLTVKEGDDIDGETHDEATLVLLTYLFLFPRALRSQR